MVQQISKPGVEITQVFQGTAPTPTAPDLIPCVVGPAFEVVDLTGADGLASSESKLINSAGDVLYQQLPMSVLPADYPTPRADADQMTVLADEVQVGLNTTNSLNQLDRNPGTAFLQFANLGHQPAIFIPNARISAVEPNVDRIILAVDVISRASVTSDHIINYSGTLSTLVSNINTAVGQTVAYDKTISIDGSDVQGLLIKSNRFGAAASITLRATSGESTSAFLAQVSNNSANTYLRVEGAGLHAQDITAVGQTTSPYVIHSTGHRYKSSTALMTDGEVSTLAGENLHVYQYDVDGNKTKNEVNAVSFTGSDFLIKGATPTSNGDLITASNGFGQSISSVMVIEARSDRLRLGVVDTLRSKYDSDGNPTDQRYLDFQLGELLQNPNPFAPKNGFFVAQNLTSLSTNATAAYIESSDQNANITDATAPSLVWTGVTDGTLSANVGNSFTIQLSDGATTSTHSFQVASTTALGTVETEMEAALGDKFNVTVNSNTLTVASIAKGDQVSLSITGTYTFGTLASTTSTGTDTLLAGIDGQSLVITFNSGSKVHTIQAQSNSIEDLITNVNQSVGATVLSYNETSHRLKVQSYLKGIASSVSIGSDTHASFGFGSSTQTAGSSRPDPDVHVNSAGNISIAPEITRNPMTGRPLNVSSTIHIAYRALRLDLTSSASTPGLIKVSNTTDLESIYGPINTRNPLALGIYFALLNAGSGTEVSALGVNEVSTAEPEGTSASYQRALEFLQSYEVYSLAPLTRSEDVIQMFDAHVKSMSNPTNRAERVVISAPSNPARRNDEVLLSTGSTGAQSTGTTNQIDLNVSPEAVLAANGIDTSLTIPFELDNKKQLFIKITVSNVTYVYSVAEVDGARVTVRTSYTSAQNGDNFYNTNSLPASFTGATFSLSLRGTVLTLPGSSLLDKTTYSETIRDKAQQYLNRRQLRLYPDKVQTSVIGGVNTSVPSFYFASALAGACANFEPQEPLTRVPLVGFNDVIGPQLDRAHLNTISAGNAVVEVDVQGQSPSLRMQGTTDPSTIENREWSVTRAVDFFAKQCRQQLRLRIGRFNITQAYLDDLTILVDSLCRTAVQNGLFRGASVGKLEQDPTQPDTILVEITLEVLYPANYIKLTLVV